MNHTGKKDLISKLFNGMCPFLIFITIFVITYNVTADNVTYTYDDAGRLTKANYENGKTITYTYDKAGNILEKKVADTSDPIPDIKANGSDGALSLIDNLLVTVALDPGSRSGENADWWVAADTPLGWFYLDAGTMSWVFVGDSLSNLLVTYQGPLFNLATLEILNIPVLGLPSGTYTIYFAVDMIMNGIIDFGVLSFDSVVGNITP